MAKFNPIRDLMPADPFNVPAGQSSKEVESLRVKLTETKNTTANLVNVIKNKNILLSKDLTKIEVLNNRLRRTIPRIPSMPGTAGVLFGEAAEYKRKTGRKRPRLPLFLPSGGGVRTKVKRPKLAEAATTARNIAITATTIRGGRNIVKKFSKPSVTTAKVPSLQRMFDIIFGGGTTKSPIKKKFVPKVTEKQIVPITQSNQNLIIPSTKVTTGNTIPYKIFPEVSRSGKIRRKGNQVLNKIQKENRLEKKADKIIADLRKTDLDAESLAFKASTDKNVAKTVGQEALLDKILGKTYMKQKTLFPTVPSIKSTVSPLIKQLRSGNVAKSKLYRTLGLDDKFTRNNFANYLEPANPQFQAKILRELGLVRGTSMKAPVSKDTFRFIMNAFKPSDFMLQQIKSGKMPTGIDPRIKIFNQLKDAGYKIKLKDIVPKKDYDLLEKGLKLEDMPFQKLDKQLQLNVPQDLSSLNIDTGITNTVIILTDPPVA